MKVLYLVFLIPLCHSLKECSTPNDVRVTSNGEGDNLWLDITWSKVENIDDADPLMGYKVKIWVIKPQVTYQIESNTEGKIAVKPHEELPHFDIKESHDNLTELDVPANKNKATVKGLKQGVTYEIGVHAYSAKCKGAVTKKMRITLGPSKQD
ncbi:unnamed protein product [Arctia plantaginis]|uniref:Fibronectin type-III domain-containing protein n=1 Tax=Arctia plantaginis TaxID=874455 RepID=A0A8S1A3V2_ARCPL|nr:unnamed protein product [Arctia plantaginis]